MRRCWPFLKLLVGAAILVGLVVRLGTGAFVEGLQAIGVGSVLAALGIGLLTTVFNAWRWCLVSRSLGLPLSLAGAVADCYRALFLNSVLPAGVLGDVHRAVNHGQQAGDVGRGVRAVVLERVAGQVVVAIVGVGVLLAQPALLAAVWRIDSVGGLLSGGWVAAGLLVLLAIVIAAAVVAVRTLRGPRAARIRSALRAGIAEARVGVLSRGTLPGVIVLSVAALAGYLALFVVAARAAGSDATVGELLPVLVLALLVMAVPFNIGGWGPREAVSAVAFGAVGFGATQGLTAAVVYGVLSLIACLPGCALLLLRRRARVDVPAPRPVFVAAATPRTSSVTGC